MSKSVYLAGKITPYTRNGEDDWRFSIVQGLEDILGASWKTDHRVVNGAWAIMQKAILHRFDYAGPFFTNIGDISGGHGGPLVFPHGLDIEFSSENARRPHSIDIELSNEKARRQYIAELCFRGIQHADLIFAWVDDTTCYGTIFELGLARALNKDIEIAYPLRTVCDIDNAAEREGNIADDLWLTFASCKAHQTMSTPAQAFYAALVSRGWIAFPDTFDSPLEAAFAKEWIRLRRHLRYPLVTQHPLLNYRLDFAMPSLKFGIELDGYTYHSDRDAFNRDRKRQRDIEALGWRLIRFSGDDIRSNITRCVEETVQQLQRLENNTLR